MAYSVTCADSGADCPASFTTESKEELIQHVQLHAREAHDMEMEPKDIEPLVKST
jgi:predicted small metal-binding protein